MVLCDDLGFVLVYKFGTSDGSLTLVGDSLISSSYPELSFFISTFSIYGATFLMVDSYYLSDFNMEFLEEYLDEINNSNSLFFFIISSIYLSFS